MDIITQSNFDEFSSSFNINKKEEEAFEYFVNYCVESKHLSTDTITNTMLESVHVGGGNDTGIDGFILIVNGKQVFSEQEISDLVDANGFLDAKFVFIQTKISSKFETSEISQFLDGVKLAFRRMIEDVANPPYNKDISDCYDIVKFIYTNASKFPDKRKPTLDLYYVTTGKYDCGNKDISSKFANAITEIRTYNLVDGNVCWS